MTSPYAFSSPENIRTEKRILTMSFTKEYSIDSSKPPTTPLGVTRAGHSTPADVSTFLPDEEEIRTLATDPAALLQNIKDKLALAATSKNLFKQNAKEPSYRDISFANSEATKPLDTAIEKNTRSFLQAVHELLLRRAQRPAWQDATFLEEKNIHPTDSTQNSTTTVDILKNFTSVPTERMSTLATQLWADPTSYTQSADGVSHYYVRKCFAELLLASLSPTLKTIIVTKLDSTLLVDGPLIWLTIAQSVFASKAILTRELKQTMTRLSVPNSNDNYEQYLQSLRSSLILSPTVQDEAVYQTFLQEMSEHPATSVKNKFSEYKSQYYDTDKLPLPFVELVDKAQRLVAIAELTDTKVPRNNQPPVKPAAKQGTAPNPPSPAVDASSETDILALIADRVDAQQKAMTQMMGLLSSLENQHKQFKANYAKNKPSSGGGNPAGPGTNRQPPFSSDAPTDPDEVKVWNDRNWYYCAKCKYGTGCWSPSHSTHGIPSLSVAPHRGGAPTNKRGSPAAETGIKRQKVDETKSRADLKVMKASFMVPAGQTMAAILAARNKAADETTK
jgi:hypothetical protein